MLRRSNISGYDAGGCRHLLLGTKRRQWDRRQERAGRKRSRWSSGHRRLECGGRSCRRDGHRRLGCDGRSGRKRRDGWHRRRRRCGQRGDLRLARPSQSGFLDAQAGQYNLTATTDNKQTIGRPPAGVSVVNANHVHFERNIFTQMGATGLDFISGTHDDMIIGNVVTDIAGNGISIGKFTASDTTEYHVPYNPSDKNETRSRTPITPASRSASVGPAA